MEILILAYIIALFLGAICLFITLLKVRFSLCFFMNCLNHKTDKQSKDV